MIAWYYCYSLPRYNIDKGQVLTLYPMQWKNEKCNDHFTEIVKKNGYHVSELIVKKYA